MRKLRLEGGFREAIEDFSSEDLGTLVAVTGSSLTELSFGGGFSSLSVKPFWELVRGPVIPAGRLRSLMIMGKFADVYESDVEPLGQLAGSPRRWC